MKSVNSPKPGYAIISCDYLNMSLANEHVGDVIIPTQVIKIVSRRISQSDCSIQIKLNYVNLSYTVDMIHNSCHVFFRIQYILMNVWDWLIEWLIDDIDWLSD
jgi:hypothetical protein